MSNPEKVEVTWKGDSECGWTAFVGEDIVAYVTRGGGGWYYRIKCHNLNTSSLNPNASDSALKKRVEAKVQAVYSRVSSGHAPVPPRPPLGAPNRSPIGARGLLGW